MQRHTPIDVLIGLVCIALFVAFVLGIAIAVVLNWKSVFLVSITTYAAYLILPK